MQHGSDDAESRGLVEVEVRAHIFERFGAPLVDGKLSFLELPEMSVRTDRVGRARLVARVGQRLTAVLDKAPHQRTQSASVVVPTGGLVGDTVLTLQVPYAWTFRALSRLFGSAPREGCRHIVTTVTAFGKSLSDCPQGEAGALLRVIRLSDGACVGDPPLYLGTVPGIHKTDFLRPLLATIGIGRPLAATTLDGGVLVPNVEFGRYRLTASKAGVEFSSCEVAIGPSSPALINASPPHSPMALRRLTPVVKDKP